MKKISKTKAFADSRANCKISSRDFALTLARSRVSLRPRVRLFEFELTLGAISSLTFAKEIYDCD